MTLSEENYLKAVYHLEKHYKKGVPTNALAEEMQTKAPSATDMVKRLARKKLLNYEPYQGSTLTRSGELHALKVIRKHRLWEYFLVEKLAFSWDEVHEIAEQLEHIQSEKLTDRLDEFLGSPTVDPHGDPIPDKQGCFAPVKKTLLSNCQPGGEGVFAGVVDSSKQFLQYLDKQHIALGDCIKIVSKETFDDSFVIVVEGVEKTISRKIAVNMYLKLEKV